MDRNHADVILAFTSAIYLRFLARVASLEAGGNPESEGMNGLRTAVCHAWEIIFRIGDAQRVSNFYNAVHGAHLKRRRVCSH
jgi:hypothetical protein